MSGRERVAMNDRTAKEGIKQSEGRLKRDVEGKKKGRKEERRKRRKEGKRGAEKSFS